MAKNTSFQRSMDSKTAHITSTNPVNDPKKNYRQSRNNFDLDYKFYSTERYGEISPFYVANSVASDVVPLINSHELRTYTLQAPLMSDVYKHKNYFQVPMKAILPRTWDLIFKNPTQGDDVPDNAYSSWPVIYNGVLTISQLSSSWSNPTSAGNLTTSNFMKWVEHFFRRVVYLEQIFSAGSLLNYLGFPASSLFIPQNATTDVKNVDDFVDIVVPFFLSKLPPLNITVGARTYTLDSNPSTSDGISQISIHRFMELIREDPSFSMLAQTGTMVNQELIDTFMSDVVPVVASHFASLDSALGAYPSYDTIDVSRLIAYQLCCAHFYSDDSIDFIYSADIFRKNAESFYLYSQGFSEGKKPVWPTFTYNGVQVLYDVFSAQVYRNVHNQFDALGAFLPSSYSDQARMDIYCFTWLSLIFQFRHSLKHGDYFTGSRPFPLAVGDVSAPVINNTVSAIDMTVNISKQRFLNAVNRFGASVDDYLEGIFGTKLPPVDTDPKWLANQSFKIFGTEIENTADEQRANNSVTTILKSNDGRYAFEAYSDVPSIYLGLSWYSVERSYVSAAERFFFHKNRFDMFNPFMQYIGDQDIKAREISVANSSVLPFGYTGRFMEYKQRFNRSVGGFANNMLSGWSASTTSEEDMNNAHSLTISPDFIRSSSVEFDKYYSSLTNLSLGTYFHFIVKYSNFNSIQRAMDYSPSIL